MMQTYLANEFSDIVRGDTKGLKNEGPFMAQWEPILDALKKPSKYGSRKELVELVQKRVDTDLLGPLSELLMIKRLVMAFEKYYEGKYGKEVSIEEEPV